MSAKSIHRGTIHTNIGCHNAVLIFQRDVVTFHSIEDGKLIILGAMSAKSLADGLYLDCAPTIE